VNSSTFLALIERGNELKKEDLHQLVKLHDSFPFFQIPMVLAAKHEHSTSSNNREFLHWAASLSPDRAWLKNLIEKPIDFPAATETEGSAAAVAEEKETPVSSDTGILTSDQPEIEEADKPELVSTPEELEKKEDKPEIISSTEAAAEEKEKPELVTSPTEPQKEEPQAELQDSTGEALKENAPEITIVPNEEEKPLIEPVPVPPHNRLEILKQLEDNLSNFKKGTSSEEPIKDAAAQEEMPETPKPKKKPRKKRGDDILDSIKKKEKKEIKDSKKKEQNDIIKAFSKQSIKRAAIKENEDVQKLEDLSKASTKINDRLVSESYAKLLTKQGKTDAAKEIYGKLILKFPEKKAYFADLMKKLEE
jgi:hypothetical protein